MKVLVAGIIARYPFGGVTWCSLMYLLGLRALGHEVLYIEDTGECIYDPEQNIDAGVKYIKYLQGRFNGNLTQTIAAYNAGEGNVLRYRGVPPFRETRTYVKKVLKNYDKRTKQLEDYKKREGGSVPEADGTLTLR